MNAIEKRLSAIEQKVLPQMPPSEDVLYRSEWFADFLARRGLTIDQLPKIDGSIMKGMPLELAKEMRTELEKTP